MSSYTHQALSASFTHTHTHTHTPGLGLLITLNGGEAGHGLLPLLEPPDSTPLVLHSEVPAGLTL